MSDQRANGLLGGLAPRRCPVCGSARVGDVFAEQAIDVAALDGFAFASRKRPERMRLRLVRCPDCDLVYANPAPDPELLAAAYAAAAFDSGDEAAFAARTYAQSLAPLIDRLPDRDGALDIGTGDGAFLGELLDLGFTGVVGVEPSAEPIAGAPVRVAGLIRQDVFRPGLAPERSLSLVTCFQTIEHVTDPAALVAGALALLKPGGVLAIVCHDRRALVNRALGMRSPIIDIEHMQLFSPASLAGLLERSGLRDVGHRPIRNRYPLRYWTRLLPLPDGAHDAAQGVLRRTGLGGLPLSVSVGNLLGWGDAAVTRENFAARTEERWQSPAFRPVRTRADRVHAAARRLFDLQAASIWRDLTEILPAARGAVLDVGSGAQPYRSLLAGAQSYRAIDVQLAGEAFGYDVADTDYYDGDTWPVATASVDLVLATETLEHVVDPPGFLAEARRVLRDGGGIVITVPFAARWHYVPWDYWRFTPSSLRMLLEAAGFDDVVVHARGNELTVACYKAIALALPGLLPSAGGIGARRLAAVALSPLVAALALVAHASLRRAGGDDCLGWTATATAGNAGRPLG